MTTNDDLPSCMNCKHRVLNVYAAPDGEHMEFCTHPELTVNDQSVPCWIARSDWTKCGLNAKMFEPRPRQYDPGLVVAAIALMLVLAIVLGTIGGILFNVATGRPQPW